MDESAVANLSSWLDDVADQLAEASRIEHTRKLLTWTACYTVGQAFERIPPSLHTQAKRELAGRARITTRTIEHYLRVYSVVRDLDLPDEALQIIQFSVARAIVEEFGEERARELLLEIHDSDLSLMQARVREIRRQIREARAARREPTLAQAIAAALGELGKRPASALNEVEREQVKRIIADLLEMSGGRDA